MRYLKGKRVRMIHMEDVDPIQPGQCGVVQFVDDLNQLHVKWDDGRSSDTCPKKTCNGFVKPGDITSKN